MGNREQIHINLLGVSRAEKEHTGLSETKIKDLFAVEIPSGLLRELEDAKTEEDYKRLQGKLDAIFNNERRSQMLERTSQTPLNTPAVFYRYMPKKQLGALIENGRQTPQDYQETEDRKFLEQLLNEYLTNYYNEMVLPEHSRYDGPFSKLPLEEKMYTLFPQVPQKRIQELLKNLNWSDIQVFLDENVPNNIKRIFHAAGSPGTELSNRLSASAGGPVIAEMMPGSRFHIEFIAPNDAIQSHAAYDKDIDILRREKEVFFKQIPIEWVTRIHVLRQHLWEESILNPESTIQKYVRARDEHIDPTDIKAAYKYWHETSDTKDMLPNSIAAKYK